ncbi:MAG: T9SS type A sorting domain-containing protein [Ignavibacteriales bacterium]|nr:T9SS type A sorting domain-containing protein [Ignavibacteriales bacterium]
MKNIVFAITFCLILINTDLFSQELNGPTSWDILGDVFSQPNVHLQVGKKKYEWYGSGDVNNDEVINNKDLEAMLSGTQNDMSDIDGDGMSSTSIDRTILQNYLNENIEHLPSHWNLLVTEDEKINWLEKMIAVEDVYKYNSDKWICENFIQQMEIDFYGISNIEKFVNEQKAAGEVEYYKPHNARFNLPLQYFATVNTNGKPYAVGGVLVGENPLNFYDWYFISMNCENNYARIFPGDFDMDGNHYAKMIKTALVKTDSVSSNNYFGYVKNLLNFDLNQNIGSLSEYDSERLLLENPYMFEVEIEEMPDTKINYQANLETTPNLTGTPKVTVRKSKQIASLDYADGKKIILNNTYPNQNYYFFRTWTAKLTQRGITKAGSVIQKIIVSDMEKPKGIVPPEISITKELKDTYGGLSTTITGKMIDVNDNSNLKVGESVNYQFIYENKEKQVYHAFHTLIDVFGNDTTFAPQFINVLKPKIYFGNIADILINAESEYQNLSSGALEAEGIKAEPTVVTQYTSAGYTLNYIDVEISYSKKFPWANRDITRTYIAALDNGEARDTMNYKIKVRDLEKPIIEDLETITITKDDSLHPKITGYPIITDNVAIKDTVIKYELVSNNLSEKNFKAIATTTDVFGNDTTYAYQNVIVNLIAGEVDDEYLPTEFSLTQNYPNPFNSNTTISYSLISTVHVSLKVFDLLGHEVLDVVNQTQSIGYYTVPIDVSRLTSGTYFYRLQAGNFVATKKMVCLK